MLLTLFKSKWPTPWILLTLDFYDIENHVKVDISVIWNDYIILVIIIENVGNVRYVENGQITIKIFILQWFLNSSSFPEWVEWFQILQVGCILYEGAGNLADWQLFYYIFVTVPADYLPRGLSGRNYGT